MVNHSGAAPKKEASPLASMTGSSSLRGEEGGRSWLWDLRSVNGKGLDVRLRIPEGLDGLDAGIRAAVSREVQRGNVSVSLRLNGLEAGAAFTVDEAGLAAALAALRQIEAGAMAAGLTVRSPTLAEILSLRQVVAAPEAGEDNSERLVGQLLQSLDRAIADFVKARQAEGRAISAVLSAQIDRIGVLVGEAAAAAEARRPAAEAALTEALRRVAASVEVDAGRLAQELALLAVKADVTEEIDRLQAHVAAARDLVAQGGPVGRRLDFLMQEFMREANTLCSKSGDKALTRIGLDLKTVIDQMREQVQNVE
jgi:uncharacterized protein (TIGR00255 family)